MVKTLFVFTEEPFARTKVRLFIETEANNLKKSHFDFYAILISGEVLSNFLSAP